MINQANNPQASKQINDPNSMRALQQQVPNRIDQTGNPAARPRLAENQRVQANPSGLRQRAKKEATNWVLWAAGGGTIGAAGIGTWFLT